MSELLGVRKYAAAVVTAGIGFSALTGCADSSAQTWEVGVVCPEGSNVQVGALDTEPFVIGQNDARIDVLCVDEAGKDLDVTSMELTKGQGAVINTNKDYTNLIEIKYEDQRDGYDPEVSMDTLLGYILADNVKIESVAVTD